MGKGNGDEEGRDNQNSRHAEIHWHAMTPDQVLSRLETSRDGLSSGQAAARLDEYGPNALSGVAGKGPLQRFLLQFHNILIYILLLAALGTALLGHWLDTWVIIGVVLINALIGFIQEGKAEKALDAIRDMLSPRAEVIRDGKRSEIDAEQLVPGDLVLLAAGDRVPADMRLVEAKSLRIDEAILTGESKPSGKALPEVSEKADLGDRDCIAFSGTIVTFGRALGVVVASGKDSQIGRISEMLAEVEEVTTPLLQQIAQFGRWLSVAIVGLAALTFAFGYLLRGYSLDEMFLAAASLAVAAIPEGLPAVLTITLAIGVQRMASRHAIIRRLPAVETLGSVTVICSDKTGTLTRNEMTVQSVVTAAAEFRLSGTGYAPHGEISRDERHVDCEDESVLSLILQAGMLCNDAELREKSGQWQLAGDPTEGALMVAGMKAGFDPKELSRAMPRTDVIPFESEHKFMATLHHDHAGHGVVYLKGAPETVLERCQNQRGEDGETTSLESDYWHQRMDELAARGQRVLAVAVRELDSKQNTLDFADVEQGLTLLGLWGIIDPPRDEAVKAVAQCRKAGIRVKMITGDHAGTALAIAEQLGITDTGREDQVITGGELQKRDDPHLQELVRKVNVFARTSPEHKLRLVTAIQANGQVVAMTGDGVNDAPALKRADVGVAMGLKGTEAAKEASEMVLADDNFASIASAVEEGRTVYDNIRKAILYLLPTNAGQAMTIMMAVLLGMVLPLTPVQVLWVNMVTAVTLGLALAFEPSEPGTMSRRPRPPGTPILSGILLWRVPFVGLLLWLGTFGAFYWLYEINGMAVELARTVAINTLVVGQVFYLFNVRYIHNPVLNTRGLFGSRVVWMAIAVILVLQMAFTYLPPLQMLFGTVNMQGHYWAIALFFGVALLLIVELEKWLLRILARTRQGAEVP